MWNGKMKAVTFSYDDGVEQDIRFIELLDRYGLRGTFTSACKAGATRFVNRKSSSGTSIVQTFPPFMQTTRSRDIR